jgi:chorismate mutase
MELKGIAEILEGLEETIIFKLIDRAQFHRNMVVYQSGESGFKGAGNTSLFKLRLLYHERMDAEFGRFMVPEERPFNTNLPKAKRIVHLPPNDLKIIDYNKVNLTAEIKESYLKLIPLICPKGDDGQYGSSVEHDVYALQAISRRIHFGAFFVAECKYRDNMDEYDCYIEKKDDSELLEKLTRTEVEENICKRVRQKVIHSQRKINKRIRNLIEPEVVISFYRDTIIPLTKRGELIYLLNRKK